MQFITALQFLAALTAVSAAPSAPHSEVSNELSKRADIFDMDCGGETFDIQDIRSTFNQFVSVANLPNNQKPAAGTRVYPQQYGNNKGIPSDPEVVAALDAIPGCKTGQSGFKYFEYPLANPVWTGGPQTSQGPHRIISIAQNVGPGGSRTYTYCTAITHRGGNGMGDGSFRACKQV
ncbi:hypothetical protein IAQ61_002272 [Plenodomus lingam]|uniref:Predicted protein n=1 Tax=Leptosphaeria maculans (strain JN3 / isolate v23.1.3 / race Av1-4-5-6-7-8) TaxID=985895 RepID=E4ZIC9_LEPMJ|nr:predicted protein [Plenodomus lingam JN3]KAH9876911.1 hypothetical protein IAQ61_002272 [Plenodomus lingam]CBX90790.1 predicted protein [Plenodomus lingam JN3]